MRQLREKKKERKEEKQRKKKKRKERRERKKERKKKKKRKKKKIKRERNAHCSMAIVVWLLKPRVLKEEEKVLHGRNPKCRSEINTIKQTFNPHAERRKTKWHYDLKTSLHEQC